jgi:hypothetical protein
MSAREYDNFDLLIEAIGKNDYRVHITSCPVGDTPSARFGLPFSTTELENLLLKLDPGRAGMRRVVEPHTRASMDLGGGLFDAVFRDEVLVAWSRSKDAARHAGHGLRLRLRLTRAPALAGLPWELLLRPPIECFLCTVRAHPAGSISRCRRRAPPRRACQVSPPISAV